MPTTSLKLPARKLKPRGVEEMSMQHQSVTDYKFAAFLGPKRKIKEVLIEENEYNFVRSSVCNSQL